MSTSISKIYQPQVKDSGSVLVGVAQVRIGLPSIRPVGTALVKAPQFVGLSTVFTDNSTNTPTEIVQPGDMSTGGIDKLPAGMVVTASGTYTGTYDGAFIIRATDATTVDIYGPNGYKDAGVLVSAITTGPYNMKLGSALSSGAMVNGLLATTITAGMTWIVPVWAGTATDKIKTGIICPYSPFSGSNESIGAIKSASVTPKISSIKTLEAGFPLQVVDQIVEKTEIDVKFECLEFTNSVVSILKNIMLQVINQAKLAALPIEVVMRTRGNGLVTYYIPSATMAQFPSIAPTNDFSSIPWEFTAIQQSMITSESDTYNAWMVNAPIFQELSYLH